ncbi:MAG: class I SAM-dependent methyltransferase [Candidatus Omnitrophota bacterium]
MKIKIIIFIVCVSLMLCGRAHGEDKDSFRFAVMGCAHAGLCNFQDYKLAVEKIKEYRPDFVLFLGSMVDTVGEECNATGAYNTSAAFKKGIKLSPEAVESRWSNFDQITKELGVPVYDVPSERSIPANNIESTEPSFLKRYHRRYYSFTHKNNLFICLDSESYNDLSWQKRGLIDGDQLNFLKESLAATANYTNTFIAMHQAAWHSWFAKENKWFERIHPLINTKVKYVFGACLHLLDSRKVDGVTYITSGAAACWPDPVMGPTFAHFLIVEVNKTDVSIKVVPIKPIPLENMKALRGKEEISAKTDFFKKVKLYIRTLVHKIGTKEKKNIVKTKKPESECIWFSDLVLPERIAIMQPDKVVETIRPKIKPGMTIVDIGAGLGIFTFRFADVLKGTGKVFATEVKQNFINCLNQKAKSGNYKNVFPVLVKSDGLDDFYKKQTFDIIFLCDTYEMLRHSDEYLRQLKPSLASDGCLYVLYLRDAPNFNKVEFDDFKKVIQILVSKGTDFPVFKRLDTKTKVFIKNFTHNDNIPIEIQEKIIDDLNGMLDDRTLFNDLIEHYAQETKTQVASYKFLDPKDVPLTQWLFRCLDENRVFDARKKNFSRQDRDGLRKLNRAALTGIFQTQKLRDVFYLDYPLFVEKDRLIARIEAVGYTFVREYDVLSNHDFLEFKRTR